MHWCTSQGLRRPELHRSVNTENLGQCQLFQKKWKWQFFWLIFNVNHDSENRIGFWFCIPYLCHVQLNFDQTCPAWSSFESNISWGKKICSFRFLTQNYPLFNFRWALAKNYLFIFLGSFILIFVNKEHQIFSNCAIFDNILNAF